MATFDSTNIQFTYVTAASFYSYSGMPLSAGLPEASQIQARYNAATVYKDNTLGNGGTLTAVSDLTPAHQEAVKVLSSSLYTVDTDKDTITLASLGDEEITIPGSNTKYYYAPNADVAATSPLVLRRSTDINSAVVTFAPGARLTAGMLNASATQLLHASQELTAFSGGVISGGGSGGDGSDVDLSGNILSDIGNVSTPTGSGVLSYDELSQTYSVGAAGSQVPAGGAQGYVLRKETAADGDTDWYNIQGDFDALNTSISDLALGEVTTNANAIDVLNDKTINILPPPNTNVTNGTAFTGDLSVTGDITATGIAGTMQAEMFEFKGNNLNGFLYMGSTAIAPGSSGNNYRIQAFPSSTDAADQRNVWRLNSAGWTYMFNRWQGNGVNVYDYPRIYQSPNQYSQNIEGTHTSVGDGAYTLARGGGGYYQAFLTSENRIYSADPGNIPYADSKMNYVHLRDDMNGQYNYTMMTSPGDYHGKAFSVIKNSATIFSVDKNAGNVFAGGDVNARAFNINSDATLKTYVPAENPNESSTKVIDKIQTMVNNGESIAGGVIPPGANANEKFGAFEYDSATGQYHYGPTTQALTANGLSVINGENINVPGEEAQAEELGEDGAADVPAVPAVPAVPSTQTISTVSIGGLAMKASSQLKDLSDEANNNIVYLTNYIQELEARVATLEGNSPTPPVLPSPTVGNGLDGGEGGQLDLP